MGYGDLLSSRKSSPGILLRTWLPMLRHPGNYFLDNLDPAGEYRIILARHARTGVPMNTKQFMPILILALAASCLQAVPRRYVLVEIGASTGCSPCQGAARGAHDLLVNGHPAAIIENFTNAPFGNVYSSARNTYYGLTGTPTAWFDGLNQQLGGSSSTSMYSIYLPKVNARLAIPAHYTISASGTATGNQYTANVVVAKPEADSNTNVVLHAAVTESSIPYTWYSQTEVNSANRLMIPSASGTPVSLATGGQVTIPISFTLNTSYNAHNCELVLWLQNTVSKEVLQCEKYPFDYLYKDFTATPTSGTAPLQVQFQNSATALGLAAHWDFQNDGVYDFTGNNPQHSYTEPGTWTVKYKLTFGTLADSLVKTGYITVSAPVLPLAPANIQCVNSGADVLLSWDPVTQDTAGGPLTPDYYEVLYSADPSVDANAWTLLTTATGLSAVDTAILNSAPQRYYRIRAVKL